MNALSSHLIETEDLKFTYDEDYQSENMNEEGFSSDSVSEINPDKLTIKGINVTIDRGEFIAVIGRNGSGKSTFAKLLNLVLEPTSGKIFINGKQITDDMTEEALLELRRTVGMVFQNPDNQLVATIVEEDVAFGPENLGLPSDEIRRRVDEALEITGMKEYAHNEPHKLSGGQKQRVAIAGIIAMMPECMIFDESTAMLDPIGRREVLDVMEKLAREKKITVINITHLMNEAARADRVLVINNGLLIGQGTPSEIFSDEALLAEAGLELPQSAALLKELISRGAVIDRLGITPDECADILINKIRNGR